MAPSHPGYGRLVIDYINNTGGKWIMKINTEYLNRLFVTAILSILTTLLISGLAHSFEFAGWGHGATGYELAVIDAKEGELPMILYFHIASDESSERLENEYLGVYEVDDFLTNIPKSEINLEGTEYEQAIASQYKVENDPALFVLFPAWESEPQGITPFQEDHDMTLNEFINNIRDIFILGYNNQANASFEKEEYDKALKYLETARGFDPNRAYAYYAIGTVYHAIAVEKKDAESAEKAEENYLKALEIDPNYKDSQEALDSLRKDIDKITAR
jgi:tetratricopeptide (TPR) repeat protein